ncbi:MAG: radical SAM family heme chaperone HemW, partial [Phycisphaerae bacterium]
MRLEQATAHTTDRRQLAATDVPAADVPGLYVHVPFCFHKCHYCDFYSITRQSPERMARFVDLVLREADMWADSPVRVRPQTVFFGGGTPSLLEASQMRRLIAGLRDRFDFDACDEFTVEVNPATASAEYCEMLRAAGVDRLSFGAQSFDPAELKLLERHHDPADVPASIALARAAGFTRLNVDLIYALPGQTVDQWAYSLDRAIELATPHVSCYALTYEPNTAMTVRKRLGQFVACPDELELDMMRYTRDRLGQAGLSAYEISNYAVEGEACRHNLLYWTGGSYVGLGPSAAS